MVSCPGSRRISLEHSDILFKLIQKFYWGQIPIVFYFITFLCFFVCLEKAKRSWHQQDEDSLQHLLDKNIFLSW